MIRRAKERIRTKKRPVAKSKPKPEEPKLDSAECRLIKDAAYHVSSALVNEIMGKPLRQIQEAQLKEIMKGVNLALIDPKWRINEDLWRIRLKLFKERKRRQIFNRKWQESGKN